MSSTTEGELLGAGEVSRRLGISRQSVYRLVRLGELPAIRLGDQGASLRFDPEQLEQWLASHQTSQETHS